MNYHNFINACFSYLKYICIISLSEWILNIKSNFSKVLFGNSVSEGDTGAKETKNLKEL